jgi:N-acetylglucosaminyl-diphospho-decaprenol L-rhamnosyltransferase
VHDLAVIIVSYGSGRWLPACLRTLWEHAGDIDMEVIVVDNDPGDEIPAIVAGFPPTRLVPAENRGFAAGNNEGLRECDARYVLFLNPDTEIRTGTFADLIARLDRSPELGIVGVRQVLPTGELMPSARHFPSASRALADALGADKLAAGRLSLGQRVNDASLYESEFECDWTAGSFMLVRREALLGAGVFDERFFLYSEEADLALRVRRAGWQVWHIPLMEILHHSDKAGLDPRIEAQQAFARRQYVQKHFAPARRAAFLGALAVRYGLRGLLAPLSRESAGAWRESARLALPLVLGRGEPPFVAPPRTAVPGAPPDARD